MATFLKPNALFDLGVTISLTKNGSPAQVCARGELGKLQAGDKLKIKISVAEGVPHACYTLNSKLETVAKRSLSEINGVYEKNFTVERKENLRGNKTRIAGFPNNMISLKIGDQEFSIGIVVQDDRYYFVIEERPLPVRADDMTIGTVLSYDLLRGYAVIYTGTPNDAKIHWTNMPLRKEIGLRVLCVGEVIAWEIEDVVLPENPTSQFLFEIKRCSLARVASS